jgi:type II secretory pathway pseudopilin PulG
MDPRRRIAFTLVEALAVLVLTALLLAGVLELLQQTTATQRAARHLTERNGQREVIEHMLRADLENLCTHAPIAKAVLSPGEAGSILEVICLGPAELQTADQLARPWYPVRARYKLDPGREDSGLVLTRRQEDLTQGGGSGKSRLSQVAANLDELKIAFGQNDQWLDHWPMAGREDALPQAVRVTWKAKNGSAEQMVVNLR